MGQRSVSTFKVESSHVHAFARKLPQWEPGKDNTRVVADSLEAAEEAGLRYVSDDQPGGSLYAATRTASANFPGISRCQSIKCGNRRTSFSLNLLRSP